VRSILPLFEIAALLVRLGDVARMECSTRQFAVRGNRRFQFHKRSQLFDGANDEAPALVAVRVSNPDRSPLRSMAETQPKLHPALLSLSAMISQSFTTSLLSSDCSKLFAARVCSVQAGRSLSVVPPRARRHAAALVKVGKAWCWGASRAAESGQWVRV